MPEVTSCSMEASKVFLDSRFQDLGLQSHFWGVCKFSFQRFPQIPWFLLDLQPSQLPDLMEGGASRLGGSSRWLGCLCPSPPTAAALPCPSPHPSMSAVST